MRAYHVACIICVIIHFLQTVYSELTFTCGEEEENLVNVQYVGDVKTVLTRDHNGVECFFTQNPATATFTLSMRMNKSQPAECYLERIVGKTYSVDVIVRVVNPILDQISDPRMRITCSYDVHINNSASHDTTDTINPPKAVTSQQGPKADAKISVTVCDMKGNPLSGAITLGKLVLIKAIMEPSNDYVGFIVTGCSVETNDGSIKFVILSGGCGTGFPIERSHGFTISGREATSPTFRLFRLIRGQGIVFKCQTSMCSTNCDGNTCKP